MEKAAFVMRSLGAQQFALAIPTRVLHMVTSPRALDFQGEFHMAGPLIEGAFMHDLARRLFPICRSITGNGVRESLAILREYLPSLKLYEIPSGTKCFDWTVPDEWNIATASLVYQDGSKILDFADSNLHVVNYSIPVDRQMSLDELQPHLHSLPELPDAIPYVTS